MDLSENQVEIPTMFLNQVWIEIVFDNEPIMKTGDITRMFDRYYLSAAGDLGVTMRCN